MSKLILWDFECSKCGVFEELAQPTEKSARCPRCDSAAPRIISPVRIDRMGMAVQPGATESSIKYFERAHRQRKAIEDKRYRDHGDYGSHAGSDGGAPVTPEVARNLG